MINDTFHQIQIGPKWRVYLSMARERVRRRNQITEETRGKGRTVYLRNMEARRARRG